MTEDDPGSLGWAELCDLHEAASFEVQAALLVVQQRVNSGTPLSTRELVRLENAQAARNAIERLMHDLLTGRRG